MASPVSPTAKRGCWVVILGLLSVVVVIVMAILVNLLLSLSPPTSAVKPTATLKRPAFSLPTASFPTATPGPPAPLKIVFIHNPDEPEPNKQGSKK